jgi:transcriptional regulator with XRE-family HTH domain
MFSACNPEQAGVASRSVKSREALKANLDALLQRRGKTRNQMVMEMGRSSAWISQILSGKRSAFLDKLDTISDYLGVEPAALFSATAPSVTPQHRTDEHDAYSPSPSSASPTTSKKSERTMLDETERTILLGYCLGVLADYPHAFARLKRAIKEATDQLHDTLEDEATHQAREAKQVGKS